MSPINNQVKLSRMAKKAAKHLRTVLVNKKFFSNTENLREYHYSVINDISSNFEKSEKTYDHLRTSNNTMSSGRKRQVLTFFSYFVGKKNTFENYN